VTSAVQRISTMSRFLPEAGYEVTVVTTSEPGVVEGDSSGVWTPSGDEAEAVSSFSRRMARVQRYLPYNDRLPWTPFALNAVEKLHAERPLSALITSAPPVASHVAGWLAKRKLRIPWIADFRDPIVGNPVRNRWWGTPYDELVERQIFRHADMVVAVTDVVAEMWKRKYPQHAAKVRVIWGCYNPDEAMPAPRAMSDARKTLAHLGFLYRQRIPWKLLESFDRLTADGRLDPREARLQFVGEVDGYEEFMATPACRRLREKGCLDAGGVTVSRARSLENMVDATHLLLIDIVNNEAVGYTVPAKIFDYVRAGRPILTLTDRNSPVDRIIAKSGVRCRTIYHDEEPEQLDAKILEFFSLPSEQSAPSEWFQDAFDGRRQMKRLGAYMDELLSPAAGSA
jgi:glycosyltransferase involved in cell wall biosynthesis